MQTTIIENNKMNDETKNEFLELYGREEKRLSAFAMALCRNRDDAKDLVSETVLRAYETFGKLKEKQAFASYLFSIASRAYKRRNWRRRIFGVWSDDVAENIPAKILYPGVGLDIELLYKCLDKLSPEMKEAIVLFEIAGFSIKEIEEIQNASASAVKLRLKRGREKLKQLMTEAETKQKTFKIYNIISEKSENGFNQSSIDQFTVRVGNEKVY